jgi:hypothetical protein
VKTEQYGMLGGFGGGGGERAVTVKERNVFVVRRRSVWCDRETVKGVKEMKVSEKTISNKFELPP